MTKPLLFLFLIAGLLLSGCTLLANPEPTPTPLPSSKPTSMGANANVNFVQAVEDVEGSWTFSVTVEHPDTGWDDYADGWDVVLPDGTVVKPDPEAAFTRVLTHPHENEQPFTRSQSGIMIPAEVNSVTVRAHDLVDGFGGREVVVYLNQPNGPNFSVERASSSELLPQVGVTNQQTDGNRLVNGSINLLNATPIDISLNATPVWVVGVTDEAGNPVLVAALEDGQLAGFRVENGAAQPIELPVSQLPAGMPPAVIYQDGKVDILTTQAPNLAPFTHPILTGAGDLAYINDQGDVVLEGSDWGRSYIADALLDARLLSDEEGNLLALVAPSDVYQHGILGDEVEAKGVALVSIGEGVNRLGIFSDQVIEGIAPIWTDLNTDGIREILLTLSNRQSGAQLVVMNQEGEIIAQGEPIGTGYRWRHQIAVAPIGPNREMEIVDVLTPHIGGVVEFFRWEGDQLVKVAEISGFTSHVIHTRNLDMAFVADLDADGRLELLLTQQDLSALGILQRSESGVEMVGELPLEGGLTSNLVGISLPDGGMVVAAGIGSGNLRVWLP
ncbi:MAG: hypothetical protein P8046_01910 [Anaerolineales bacterium]